MQRFGLADTVALGVLVIVGPTLLLPPWVATPLATSTVGGLGASALNARQDARRMTNATQLRGIHQSLVTFAQTNKTGGGDGWFPGCDPMGRVTDPTPAGRFKTLLDGDFFTPEYAVAPGDGDKRPWDPLRDDAFTVSHFSYALLEIDNDGGRHDEWKETLNTMAVVAGDRNTGEDTDDRVRSIWTHEPGRWHGSVVHNDNHTALELSHVIDELQYGSSPATRNDNLFDAEGDDDALLVHHPMLKGLAKR